MKCYKMILLLLIINAVISLFNVLLLYRAVMVLERQDTGINHIISTLSEWGLDEENLAQ